MSEQNRKYHRLPVETRTFIELESAAADGAEPGTVITCETLNVSREGLQVMVAEEVLIGTILQIGVDLPAEKNTLYLAAEVRWCVPVKYSTHPWAAGFQVLKSDGTDITRWRDLLIGMED